LKPWERRLVDCGGPAPDPSDPSDYAREWRKAFALREQLLAANPAHYDNVDLPQTKRKDAVKFASFQRSKKLAPMNMQLGARSRRTWARRNAPSGLQYLADVNGCFRPVADGGCSQEQTLAD
jgi:hypothetical protein